MLSMNSAHKETEEGNETTKNFSFSNSTKKKQENAKKNEYL